MTGSGGVWYHNFADTTRRKHRHIHGLLCFVRLKLIPRIRQDVRWKQYLVYHHAQLGINVLVNQYAQVLEQYRIRCLHNEGKAIISNHALKVKFVVSLLP